MAPRCWPNAFQRLLAASFIFVHAEGVLVPALGGSHGAAGCLANATAGWHDLPNTGKRHLDAVEWVGFYDDSETWFFITLLEVACLRYRNAKGRAQRSVELCAEEVDKNSTFRKIYEPWKKLSAEITLWHRCASTPISALSMPIRQNNFENWQGHRQVFVTE